MQIKYHGEKYEQNVTFLKTGSLTKFSTGFKGG